MFQKRAKIWLNIPKNGNIEQKCSKNWAKIWLNIPKKWKNRSRTPKIPPGKIEYNGRKLTNFQRKKIKNKILIKIEFTGQKLIKKKKNDISGQKSKLGLNLRAKKGLFWAKILIKIGFKGQKLLKKKKKMTYRAEKASWGWT